MRDINRGVGGHMLYRLHYLIFVLLCITFPIQAYIVKYDIWLEKKSDGRLQYVHCLCDEHEEIYSNGCYRSVRDNQTRELLATFARFSFDKTKVIVEDLGAKCPEISSEDCLLHDLSSKLRRAGLDVINIERRANLGKAINIAMAKHYLNLVNNESDEGIAIKNDLLSLGNDIPISSILDELEMGASQAQIDYAKKEYALYNLLKINESKVYLFDVLKSIKNLSDVFTVALMMATKLPFVDYAITNNAEIFSKDSQVEHIFIIAGSKHIEKVKPSLNGLGYTLVETKGSNFFDKNGGFSKEIKKEEFISNIDIFNITKEVLSKLQTFYPRVRNGVEPLENFDMKTV